MKEKRTDNYLRTKRYSQSIVGIWAGVQIGDFGRACPWHLVNLGRQVIICTPEVNRRLIWTNYEGMSAGTNLRGFKISDKLEVQNRAGALFKVAGIHPKSWNWISSCAKKLFILCKEAEHFFLPSRFLVMHQLAQWPGQPSIPILEIIVNIKWKL